MTNEQIVQSAQALVSIANSMKALYVRSKEYSDYNSVTDPNWNDLANTHPSAVVNGLIIGTSIVPSDVANAIGSVNEFINYWSGQVVPQSAWGQNIEKVSNPIV